MEPLSRDPGLPSGLPPILAAVRRRHPDVDLVLVCDEPAPETDEEPTPEADLTAALERVTAHATGAWASVADAGEPLLARLEPGPAENTVVARARAVGVRDDSPLPVLEQALAAAGWVTGRPSAGLELLAGRRPGVDLLASYAPTAVVTLTVSSAPLPVGVGRARELTAEPAR